MTKIKVTSVKVKRNQTATCSVVLGVTGQESVVQFSLKVDPDIFTITEAKRGINMPDVMDSVVFEADKGTIHVVTASVVNFAPRPKNLNIITFKMKANKDAQIGKYAVKFTDTPTKRLVVGTQSVEEGVETEWVDGVITVV